MFDKPLIYKERERERERERWKERELQRVREGLELVSVHEYCCVDQCELLNLVCNEKHTLLKNTKQIFQSKHTLLKGSSRLSLKI